MKKIGKFGIYGLIMTFILIVTGCILMYILVNSSLLTSELLLIAGAVFLSLTVAVNALTRDSRRRVRTVLGTILALVVMLVEFCVGYYVGIGVGALEEITVPESEYAEIGVFVKKDDSAQNLSDTKGYTFGILDVQDRIATDFALEEISKQLGEDVTIKEYAGIAELMDGLLVDKDSKAIILNKSFLDLLEDIEGHENDQNKIRELYSLKIENDSVPQQAENSKRESEDVFSVYISGIDCYGSVSRRSRSDVNILATVNIKTGQVLLLSTPRDYYVPLSISNGIPDKLTHAGIYGVDVSLETLEMLYDTEIDYYFRVNFDGFKDIIDALDGITVVSDYSFSSGKFSFKKGENKLNGEEALAFSRERYNVSGGDRQRGRNQMAVISAIIDKATGPALLKNYKKILDGVTGSFETSMPYKKISKLIQRQLKESTKWNVVMYSVDGTGAARKPYSLSSNAYVMIPKKSTVNQAKKMIEQVENDKVPRQ